MRFLLALVMTLMAMPSWAGLCTGLTSYWKLEESSGTRVDSKGTNHLTANNTPGNSTGIIGNAVALVSTSSQYLSVADNASLAPGSALSISFWIYRHTGGSFLGVMGKDIYSSSRSWFIEINEGGAGDIQFYTPTSTTDTGATNGHTAIGLLTLDTFVHVVWVFDGSQSTNATRLVCYINGVAKTLTFSGTVPSSLPANNAAFEIGRRSTLGRYFEGRIDEVALYNVALTSANVTSLYNSGAGLGYGSICGGISGARAINEGGSAGVSASRTIQ